MFFPVVQFGMRCAMCGLGAAALLLTAGCSRSHSRTVAVIPETTAQELWEAEHAGVVSAAMGTRWEVLWNGPSRKDDVARQIELVENAIENRDGGVILAPDHALALNTLVRRAVARGISTVVVGSPLSIPPNPKLAYILNDDEAGGILAADRAGETLHGRGSVGLIGSDQGTAGTALRAAALEHRLSVRYPGVQVIHDLPDSRTYGQSLQSAQQMLERHPGLDLIIAVDIEATRSTFAALKGQHSSRRVKLIACDQDLDFLYYLRRGEIDSIVAENTFEMGYRAMNLVKAGQSGESISGKVMLSPVLVTRENVDHPEVQRMLSMDWRPTR